MQLNKTKMETLVSTGKKIAKKKKTHYVATKKVTTQRCSKKVGCGGSCTTTVCTRGKPHAHFTHRTSEICMTFEQN